MRNRMSLQCKLSRILFCLAPIAIVAAITKTDLLNTASNLSIIQTVKVTAKEEEKTGASNAIESIVTGTTKQASPASIDVELPATAREISLTEMDWIIRFKSGGNYIDQSIECKIPESLKDRFSALVSKANDPINNLPEIHFETGRILRKSRGPDCHSAAYKHFQTAAQSGYARAFAEIANAYRKGLGVTPNFKKALGNYERSALLGFANSAYQLIVMVEKGGDDIQGDPVRASQYLDEFLPLIEEKIRKGDAVAARSLGRLYNNSNLVQLDPNKAIRFMEHAANLGDAIAMHDLVLLLIQHRRIGLKRKDVFPLLLESSRLGYSAAFTAIGRLHLKGDFGFPEGEAATWFRYGVDAGHPGAMAELAELYFRGEHVVQDVGIAKDLATQGARLNHLGSKRILGEILQFQERTAEEG